MTLSDVVHRGAAGLQDRSGCCAAPGASGPRSPPGRARWPGPAVPGRRRRPATRCGAPASTGRSATGWPRCVIGSFTVPLRRIEAPGVSRPARKSPGHPADRVSKWAPAPARECRSALVPSALPDAHDKLSSSVSDSCKLAAAAQRGGWPYRRIADELSDLRVVLDPVIKAIAVTDRPAVRGRSPRDPTRRPARDLDRRDRERARHGARRRRSDDQPRPRGDPVRRRRTPTASTTAPAPGMDASCARRRSTSAAPTDSWSAALCINLDVSTYVNARDALAELIGPEPAEGGRGPGDLRPRDRRGARRPHPAGDRAHRDRRSA